MPWLAPELQPLLAVAVAALDQDGILLEANAGFLKLLAADAGSLCGMHVAKYFIQPKFLDLCRAQADEDGTIYCGLLTIGEYLNRSQSLRAHIWRKNKQIRLIAEYDIEELERLYDKVLALNNDYANAQLELAQTNMKLQQRETQITLLAMTDHLTGVGNRRRMEQALEFEIQQTQALGNSFCIILADLDHFKHINDNYGHEAGDKVLAAFGALLRRLMRASDIITRFGGEEFVVLMPNTDLSQAIAVAERIRSTLSADLIDPVPYPVTASLGVAMQAPDETGNDLLHRVDNALYQAKQTGRNRVVAA